MNSDKGTRTLLNLNQGDRFDVLVMPPADGKHATGLDEELYRKCSYNVGLYKNVVAKLDSGEIDHVDVEEYASKKLRRIGKTTSTCPYPCQVRQILERGWLRRSPCLS